MDRNYIRVENGNVRYCPANDHDGSVTGKIVFNVPAYFDENPGEARRLGWVKHIKRNQREIRKLVDWDPQSQYLVTTLRWLDEWTVEDEYHVMDKSEEMMLREEMASLGGYTNVITTGGVTFIGGGDFDE